MQSVLSAISYLQEKWEAVWKVAPQEGSSEQLAIIGTQIQNLSAILDETHEKLYCKCAYEEGEDYFEGLASEWRNL